MVPQITGALAECARHYTGRKPVIISPEIHTGLTMGVDEPHAVGKDVYKRQTMYGSDKR